MSRSLTIFKGQIWEEREGFRSESRKQRDKKAYHTKVPTHQYSKEEIIFTLQAKNKIKTIQKNLSPTAQIRKKNSPPNFLYRRYLSSPSGASLYR